MIEIKILGTGCPKCRRLEQLAAEALEEVGIEETTITKVTHMRKIMEYPIVSTPGLVINEEIKCSGRLPRKAEVVAWLQEAR